MVTIKVSVPSRGLCFQSFLKIFKNFDCKGGFRPLSGIVFSIYQQLVECCESEAFPSPLGDCVFNHGGGYLVYDADICFRPLSGIVFSIDKIYRQDGTLKCSFRPLSGIVFSIRTI